jgi:hypothetical protein
MKYGEAGAGNGFGDLYRLLMLIFSYISLHLLQGQGRTKPGDLHPVKYRY